MPVIASESRLAATFSLKYDVLVARIEGQRAERRRQITQRAIAARWEQIRAANLIAFPVGVH